MRDRGAEMAPAKAREIVGIPAHPRMPDRVRGQRRQCARLAAPCGCVEEFHQSDSGPVEEQASGGHARKFFRSNTLPVGAQGRRKLHQLFTIA